MNAVPSLTLLSVVPVVRMVLLVYNVVMAKRNTGVGKYRKTHSYKTKKRLGIKHKMLQEKAAKRRRRR